MCSKPYIINMMINNLQIDYYCICCVKNYGVQTETNSVKNGYKLLINAAYFTQ